MSGYVLAFERRETYVLDCPGEALELERNCIPALPQEAKNMAWMRTKPEDEQVSTPGPSSAPTPSSKPSTPTAKKTTSPAPPRETQAGSGKAVNIGPSVHIKGTLSGREDLTVDGKVDGKITLKDHVLTIGTNGQIEAALQAKAVIVHGKVVGDITANDRVEIASSGTVTGDVRAPRVAIADGAMFRGSVDMDTGSSAKVEKTLSQSSNPPAEMPRSAKAAS
jgi:cytoskeletal protein CcmA (bactofilin family)